MHNEEEQNQTNEELQENVALDPLQEEIDTQDFSQNNPNHPFLQRLSQGMHSKDSTSNRIQDVVNRHKNSLNQPHLPNANGKSNKEQKEPSAIGQAVDQAVNKAGGAAISAATGGVIPPKVAEGAIKLAKNIMPKTISQKILEFLGFFPESITNSPILSKAVLSFGSGIFVFILLISVIVLGNGRGTEGKNELATYLSYGVVETEGGKAESLSQYLINGGWCDDKNTCWQTSAYHFFDMFRNTIIQKLDEHNEANENNGCKKNLLMDTDITSLLLGTIFFNRSDDELLSSEAVDSWKFFQFSEEINYIIEAMYVKDRTQGIDDACYYISSENYKEAIIKSGGYIDLYRSDLGTGLSNELKLEIYEAMVTEANIYIGKETNNISSGNYTECSGITVVDENDNVVGTYSLEEYVAGVVTGEMYEYFPMESKKALAVAARTYVLVSTDSCKNPIESSSKRQNFNPNIRDDSKEAANATAGQILVDENGSMFSTEYDSWNCKGENTCTYTKKPNGETHEVTITDKYLSRAAGGHGRGMSQIAAADMADQGKGYQDILLYFYSEGVTISNLTPSGGMSGQKFTSTAPIHSNVNGLYNSPFYNKNAANLGQCVWYARSRAQEILYYSNMPDGLKTTAINSIKSTYGNGEAWYRNPDGTLFAKSTNVNEPRAGAIVSWSGGVDRCGNVRCGHVAIIESVNADGTVTISEGWKSGDWNSNEWSTVKYQTVKRTLDYVKYHTNSNGNPYYFNGYVYLLG